MLPDNLSSITLQHINDLVADKVSEGKRIEYKQTLHELKSDNLERVKKQKTELLKDLSAFANAFGGDLIFGIREEDAIPQEVCGIPKANLDDFKLQMTQLAEKWLVPRISFDSHEVDINTEKTVLIVRVRQSLIGPHRVVLNGSSGPFYYRNPNGVSEMDTTELRQAFAFSDSVFEKINTFRRRRVEIISSREETPIPLQGTPKLILHLIPVQAFSSNFSLSLDRVKHSLPLLSQHGGNITKRWNIDGLLTYSSQSGLPSQGYSQLFRNGVAEFVRDDIILPSYSNDEKLVNSCVFQELSERLPGLVRHLYSFGSIGDMWLFVSISDAFGLSIVSPSVGRRRPYNIDRRTVLLPEFVIEGPDSDIGDTVLRPMFDMIWNSFGEDSCPHINSEGLFHI